MFQCSKNTGYERESLRFVGLKENFVSSFGRLFEPPTSSCKCFVTIEPSCEYLQGDPRKVLNSLKTKFDASTPFFLK
jgi:hypothetical protein